MSMTKTKNQSVLALSSVLMFSTFLITGGPAYARCPKFLSPYGQILSSNLDAFFAQMSIGFSDVGTGNEDCKARAAKDRTDFAPRDNANGPR